jgi:hypothetical protein
MPSDGGGEIAIAEKQTFRVLQPPTSGLPPEVRRSRAGHTFLSGPGKLSGGSFCPGLPHSQDFPCGTETYGSPVLPFSLVCSKR